MHFVASFHCSRFFRYTFVFQGYRVNRLHILCIYDYSSNRGVFPKIEEKADKMDGVGGGGVEEEERMIPYGILIDVYLPWYLIPIRFRYLHWTQSLSIENTFSHLKYLPLSLKVFTRWWCERCFWFHILNGTVEIDCSSNRSHLCDFGLNQSILNVSPSPPLPSYPLPSLLPQKSYVECMESLFSVAS